MVDDRSCLRHHGVTECEDNDQLCFCALLLPSLLHIGISFFGDSSYRDDCVVVFAGVGFEAALPFNVAPLFFYFWKFEHVDFGPDIDVDRLRVGSWSRCWSLSSFLAEFIFCAAPMWRVIQLVCEHIHHTGTNFRLLYTIFGSRPSLTCDEKVSDCQLLHQFRTHSVIST